MRPGCWCKIERQNDSTKSLATIQPNIVSECRVANLEAEDVKPWLTISMYWLTFKCSFIAFLPTHYQRKFINIAGKQNSLRPQTVASRAYITDAVTHF